MVGHHLGWVSKPKQHPIDVEQKQLPLAMTTILLVGSHQPNIKQASLGCGYLVVWILIANTIIGNSIKCHPIDGNRIVGHYCWLDLLSDSQFGLNQLELLPITNDCYILFI